MDPIETLLLRVLQGEATEAEQAELRRWREASPENEARFRERERLWALLGEAEPRVPVSERPSARTIVDIANGRAYLAEPGRGRSRRIPAFAGLAAAAVAVLVLGVVWPKGDVGPTPVTAREFATGRAEGVTLHLDEGTIVRLGPASRLELRPTRGETEVFLDGRAFFAVAKGYGRRFVVRTRAGEAMVLGTRFEVDSRGDDLRIVVVEGKVTVTRDGRTAEVAEGEVGVAPAGAEPQVRRVDNVHELLDWMGRSLVFRDTPMSRVVREIGHRYGLAVRIADAVLEDRTVTAAFTDQSLDQVLDIICRVIDARWEVRNDAVVILANTGAAAGTAAVAP